MKHYPPRQPKPRIPPLKLPPFHAVQTRARVDGWTPIRQAEFIGYLAETRSVSAAAKAVFMTRESAYRLRKRAGAEGFAAVWDMALARRDTQAGQEAFYTAHVAARAALSPSRKVTLDALNRRFETGKYQAVLYCGRFAYVRQVYDTKALFVMLRRVGRSLSAQRRMRQRA